MGESLAAEGMGGTRQESGRPVNIGTGVQPGIEPAYSRRLDLRSAVTAHEECAELRSATAPIASQYAASPRRLANWHRDLIQLELISR